MAQDGLAAFEPAYVDELAAIMEWAFDYIQREGAEDERGTLVSRREGRLGLSAPVDAAARAAEPADDARASARSIIDGGYWLRRPEPGTELAIVYTGAVAPEAVEAAGLLSEDRRGVGVLAVTSADRLSAGWHAAQRAREQGQREVRAPVETLLSALPRDAAIVTVTDAYPEALSWIGGVSGHRVRALGVEHFGQSGSIPELYGHYGLDVNAILGAAEGISGRPVRYRSLREDEVEQVASRFAPSMDHSGRWPDDLGGPNCRHAEVRYDYEEVRGIASGPRHG